MIGFCAESWIQYGYDETTRKYFKANRTTEGTYPSGSEWTKNPIANCAPDGGLNIRDPRDLPCPDVRELLPNVKSIPMTDIFQALMFEPAYPEMAGQGFSNYPITMFGARFEFNVMDEVLIPADLEVC